MAQQVLGIGTTAGDGTGDPARVGAQKINANFVELYEVTADLAGTAVELATDIAATTGALAAHVATTGNPHLVTKTDLGLENVPNVDATARANHTGTQLLATISNAGTAAALNAPASGDAAAGEVVKGSDTRLTNARTPTAHKSTHATGGTDALTAADIGAETPTGAQTKVDTHAAVKASASTLGHFKVGAGLTMAGDGTLSTTGSIPPEYRAGLLLPGVTFVQVTTLALAANSLYYAPILIEQSGTLTELHAEIVTASGAGTRCKLLLYDLNADHSIGALRAESGHLAADTTGVRSLTGLSITVTRGDKFALTPWCEASPTFRVVRGNLRSLSINPLLGATEVVLNTLRAASVTYGASAPTPGPVPATVSYGTSPLPYIVFPKIV